MAEQITPEEWMALPDDEKFLRLATGVQHNIRRIIELEERLLRTAKLVHDMSGSMLEMLENSDFNTRFTFDADGKLQTRKGEL